MPTLYWRAWIDIGGTGISFLSFFLLRPLHCITFWPLKTKKYVVLPWLSILISRALLVEIHYIVHIMKIGENVCFFRNYTIPMYELSEDQTTHVFQAWFTIHRQNEIRIMIFNLHFSFRPGHVEQRAAEHNRPRIFYFFKTLEIK